MELRQLRYFVRIVELGSMGRAALEVIRHPVTMGYTLAVGCIFGSFICYLGTSQQIFAEQYAQGEWFAVWFGVFAVAIAIAMLLNAKLVMRYGMRNLSKWALRGSVILSAVFLAISLVLLGHPPLWVLVIFIFVNFFFSGILFGN